jgi:hypothetical protein
LVSINSFFKVRRQEIVAQEHPAHIVEDVVEKAAEVLAPLIVATEEVVSPKKEKLASPLRSPRKSPKARASPIKKASPSPKKKSPRASKKSPIITEEIERESEFDEDEEDKENAASNAKKPAIKESAPPKKKKNLETACKWID